MIGLDIWQVAGRPEPPGLDPTMLEGECCLTGWRGPCWPAKKVLSANFADHDRAVGRGDLIGIPGAWLVAVWGPLRGERSRWRDMSITGTVVSRGGIMDLRRGDPLPPVGDPSVAVIVPTTRKSHTWIRAAYGAWTSDAGTVYPPPSIRPAVDLFAHLRSRGLGEEEARERTPRPTVLDRLDLDYRQAVEAWDALRPLRDRPALLDMLIVLTRRAKP